MALTRGDIDAIRTALRPRIGGSAGGSTTVAPHTHTTIPVHTHSADEITFEPAGNLAGDDVQEVCEELDAEKLARDGSQTMLGALPMDHHSIDDIDDADIEGTATVAEDLTFTGAAGLAKITGARELTFDAGATAEATVNNARVIHLVGDDDDGEALIDGVERLTFNDEPTKSVIENPSVIQLNPTVIPGTDTTHFEGQLSWSAVEGIPQADVAEGDVRSTLGWVVLRWALEPPV